MNDKNIKKLGINDYKTYKELQNLYKEAFEKMLMNKINLKEYQDKISNSSLGFGKVNNKPILKSGLNEYFDLNSFYLLNNFRIEKLSKESLNYLKSNDINGRIKLVEQTYKEVLKDNYLHGKYIEEPYQINYLFSSSNLGYALNNELFIAIYYGLNTEEYGSIDAYLENYNEKRGLLEFISSEIKDKIKRELGLSCKIIYEKLS